MEYHRDGTAEGRGADPASVVETSLVVAADVACASGKVRKALRYGVPVVDETQLPFVLARSRRSRTAA